VLRALEEPSRQIATNAGEEGSVIVRDMMQEKGGVGFNAANGSYLKCSSSPGAVRHG